jgi:hypothetical protein
LCSLFSFTRLPFPYFSLSLSSQSCQ